MRQSKNKFIQILLALLIGITFNSCDPVDEYWVDSPLDHEIPEIRRGGYFETFSSIYIGDLGINNSKLDIQNIVSRNSWIELDNVFRGDEIYIYDITINGITLKLDYRINIGPVPNNDRFITNDPRYIEFMNEAMQLLNNKGRIDIRITGSSNRITNDVFYIILGNDLDILVRE